MIVPFYRPSITQVEINEVMRTLRSGWLTTGPKTKRFEQEFARYLGQRHAVAVNSCTAALHLALEASGLKAGKLVVVPTMTFAATAEVVRYFNAHPLLVDCRAEDFNLDAKDAERRIESALSQEHEVTAIIPVHYGGQVGDIAGVSALARRFNLKVIEDAAHCCPAYFKEKSRMPSGALGKENKQGRQKAVDLGHRALRVGQRREGGGNGAEGSGQWTVDSGQWTAGTGQPAVGNGQWQPVGAWADISCFSFYANKCITTGEGGMACTQRDDYAERMRIMSLHGISKDAWKRFTAEGSWYYEIVAPGYKYNLTDIAAAMGIHQLRRADELHRKRAQWAALYTELLSQVEELTLPAQQPGRIHSWHLYVIRLRLDRLTITRNEVIEELKRQGITTSVHWMPLHLHPYYRERYCFEPYDFPVAARLYQEIVTLPLYPGMTEAEVSYVCDALKQIIAGHRRAARSRPPAAVQHK
jgi:dTDP-4-amino-4,6-dideoxygalactose transaminase